MHQSRTRHFRFTVSQRPVAARATAAKEDKRGMEAWERPEEQASLRAAHRERMRASLLAAQQVRREKQESLRAAQGERRRVSLRASQQERITASSSSLDNVDSILSGRVIGAFGSSVDVSARVPCDSGEARGQDAGKSEVVNTKKVKTYHATEVANIKQANNIDAV